MKIKFIVCLFLIFLSNSHFGQSLSFQLGLSTDVYVPEKKNTSYNKKIEFYHDFLGLNISYSPKLDTLKNRELIFFLDLYRFNFGTSIGSYPETENMDFTKLSTAGVLSPNIGFLYGVTFFSKDKLSVLGLVGSSLRFNLFSMGASGTFINEGEDGIEYLVLNELKKKMAFSLSLDLASQIKYKINKGTNLLFTPLLSIGTFNWYEQVYDYEFKKDNIVFEQGINNMRNNGSRFQLLVGFEFKL